MFAVGRKEVITEQSTIKIIVHDKNRNTGKTLLKENAWLTVGQDSDTYSSMLAKQLPVSDKDGWPLGIINSFAYVRDTNVAVVQLVTRGTCLLYDKSLTDSDLKRFGWAVKTIDDQYSLVKQDPTYDPATGPLPDDLRKTYKRPRLEKDPIKEDYISLVTIFSAPVLAVAEAQKLTV